MKPIKVAIHHREGSFSERWIKYCREKQIPYEIVNCYDTNILNLLKTYNFTHLLWHLNHSSSQDINFASIILNCIDELGIKTFPNHKTRWHFDNKIAQKYLFESLEAPMVKSYVYYSKEEGIKKLENIKYPIVAKLKRGAGSSNVRLLRNEEEALVYIKKMFGEGLLSVGKSYDNLDYKIRLARKSKSPLKLFKKFFSHLKKTKYERKLSIPEKGYFYFQEFLPNNHFDTRIIAIGDKAFGIRRFTAVNDFRASGSGLIDYDASKIDVTLVKIATYFTKKIGAQCLAYDFIYDTDGLPKIVEICFAFSMLAYDKCEGYWNKDFSFVKGSFNPQEFMIKNLIESEF